MPTCPAAPISTRRMLTVTISAPLAAIASRMTSKFLYLPVPTMRRDRNTFPPIVERVGQVGSTAIDMLSLPASS